MSNTNHPFWVIVNKEISDYVRSWRFIILIAIIALTCMGSLYTALTNIREAIKPNDPDGAFLFLTVYGFGRDIAFFCCVYQFFRTIVRNFIRVRCH